MHCSWYSTGRDQHLLGTLCCVVCVCAAERETMTSPTLDARHRKRWSADIGHVTAAAARRPLDGDG